MKDLNGAARQRKVIYLMISPLILFSYNQSHLVGEKYNPDLKGKTVIITGFHKIFHFKTIYILFQGANTGIG